MTGSPRPAVRRQRPTVTLRQWSRPLFQTAHQFIEASIFSGSGQEEGFCSACSPVFNGQRNIAHLRQAAANDDAELRGEVFLAIALAATRIAVSRAEERPPPR